MKYDSYILNLYSRFVKNLEPSQISLKFLKGEGELFNLELNEKVLTDLLELPPWLQLKKATCNRICAKVFNNKIRNIFLFLFIHYHSYDV